MGEVRRDGGHVNHYTITAGASHVRNVAHKLLRLEFVIIKKKLKKRLFTSHVLTNVLKC